MSDRNASPEEIEGEIGSEESQGDGVLETTTAEPDTTYWEEDDEDLDTLAGEELSDEEIRASFANDDVDKSEEGDLLELAREEIQAFQDKIAKGAEGVRGEGVRRASWHLAASLVRFRSEIDRKWPNRDKRSDGSIGDAAHSVRPSDHNPNSRRSVNAIDVDKDGISPYTVVNAAKKHPSCNYVIFNRVIYSRSYGFRGRRYTGANPHTHHIHISILQTPTAEQSTRGWLTGGTVPAPEPEPPASRSRYELAPWPFPGDTSRYFAPYLNSTPPRYASIERVQRKLYSLGYTVGPFDGRYGATTRKAVIAFQRNTGLEADALIGYRTWTKLRSK